MCGASLISPDVVLTAAHCVNDTAGLEGRLMVRCGEWDTHAEDEELPHQQLDVKRILKHPAFNVDNHHNNFALLFTETPFKLAKHISPICLPEPGRAPTAPDHCVSHGWGKDKFGSGGKYQEVLKEVVVPVVNHDVCQKDLRENTRLGIFFELDSSFMCAGGVSGVDTCKGDGGSPLVCKMGNSPWYQAGIVSWGIGCGEKNVPAVYASVATASCWIDNEVMITNPSISFNIMHCRSQLTTTRKTPTLDLETRNVHNVILSIYLLLTLVSKILKIHRNDL